MSAVDTAFAAIREQAPYDVRRETRWQYQRRLAQAVVESLAAPSDPKEEQK